MNKPSVIPPIGAVTQEQRMFLINWASLLVRSPAGVPLLPVDFVARQGRRVRVVDLRTEAEMVGKLGYIPGSEWVPLEEASAIASRLPKDEPLVLVSRAGERASQLAKALEDEGFSLVAALQGGIVAWRDLGYGTSRDRAVLASRGVLAPPRPAATEPASGRVDAADVAEHLGDPRAIRWMKVAGIFTHGHLACVDGRDETGVVGTPGGDVGKLLLALAALERLAGRALDVPTVEELFARRFAAFGGCYLHTDVKAANTLISALRADRRFDAALSTVSEALEWRAFFADPPKELSDALLEHMLVPDHIGCGHLRLALTKASDYGTRPELVRACLGAFLRLRWDGMPESEYVVLPGGHAERAVLIIELDAHVRAFSNIPLVSPASQGMQAFISHPQVVSFIRHELAEFLVQQSDLLPELRGDAQRLHEEIEALSQTQQKETLGALAKGLPIFRAIFRRDGTFRVEEAGAV